MRTKDGAGRDFGARTRTKRNPALTATAGLKSRDTIVPEYPTVAKIVSVVLYYSAYIKVPEGTAEGTTYYTWYHLGRYPFTTLATASGTEYLSLGLWASGASGPLGGVALPRSGSPQLDPARPPRSSPDAGAQDRQTRRR